MDGTGNDISYLNSLWFFWWNHVQISLPKKAAAKCLGFPNILLFGFCWTAMTAWQTKLPKWRVWKKCLEICHPQHVLIHTWIFQICKCKIPAFVVGFLLVKRHKFGTQKEHPGMCFSPFPGRSPGRVETSSTPDWNLNCRFFERNPWKFIVGPPGELT